MLASKFKCVLHNILGIFLRHSKFMLLSVLEQIFSLRMRAGKTYLIWRQFSAYWREIRYSFLHSRNLFLLYIHLNKFDITGGLTFAINITHSGYPARRKTWVHQKLPAQSAWQPFQQLLIFHSINVSQQWQKYCALNWEFHSFHLWEDLALGWIIFLQKKRHCDLQKARAHCWLTKHHRKQNILWDSI